MPSPIEYWRYNNNTHLKKINKFEALTFSVYIYIFVSVGKEIKEVRNLIYYCTCK